jgi:hypothetical protein
MRDDAVVQQQAGPRGGTLGEQIRGEVQRAMAEARADAARQAQDAAKQAQDAAARAGRAAPDGPPGSVFKVGPGGELIVVPPGEVAATAQAGEPSVNVDVDPFRFQPEVPPEVVDISIAFFMMIAFIIVGLPIARAFGRRMDRRGAVPDRHAAEQTAQLQQIQTAVEAMAVEVERISENQRFVTRLLAEGGPAGAKVAAPPLGEMREAR